MFSTKDIALQLLLCCIISNAWAQTAWEQKSSFPASGRHRASSCAIANRGYLGLGHYNSTGEVIFNDWWEYDPGSDSWAQKSNLPSSPRFGAVSLGIGNFGYVIAGNNGSVNLSDAWKYDPVTNTWSAIAGFPGSASGKAVGAVVNGKGYVGNAEATSAWYVYDPALNVWSPCANFPGPQRNFSSVFSLNDKIYIGTGITFQYTTMYNDLWCYDPLSDSWSLRASLPTTPRYCTQGFAVNGKGYIGLGYSTITTNNFNEIYEYDDVTDSWTQAASFTGTARRLTTAFVLNNRVFLGTGTNGTNFNDFWSMNPLVGMTQNQVEEINFFPNPVTEKLNVRFAVPVNEGIVSVCDINGRQIRELSVNGNYCSIDFTTMPTGIYFISIKEQDQVLLTKKIFRI